MKILETALDIFWWFAFQGWYTFMKIAAFKVNLKNITIYYNNDDDDDDDDGGNDEDDGVDHWN